MESVPNKTEGSSEEVSTLGSAPNVTTNSTVEVSSLSTLVDEKKELKDESSKQYVTGEEQLAFMTAERSTESKEWTDDSSELYMIGKELLAFLTAGTLTWNACCRGPDSKMWIEKGKEEVQKFEDCGAILKINKEDLHRLRNAQKKFEVINTFALPQEKFDPVSKKFVKKVRMVSSKVS